MRTLAATEFLANQASVCIGMTFPDQETRLRANLYHLTGPRAGQSMNGHVYGCIRVQQSEAQLQAYGSSCILLLLSFCAMAFDYFSLPLTNLFTNREAGIFSFVR